MVAVNQSEEMPLKEIPPKNGPTANTSGVAKSIKRKDKVLGETFTFELRTFVAIPYIAREKTARIVNKIQSTKELYHNIIEGIFISQGICFSKNIKPVVELYILSEGRKRSGDLIVIGKLLQRQPIFQEPLEFREEL